MIIECPICLEEPNEPVVSICGHAFCEPCLKKSLKQNEKCPVCLRQLPSGNETTMQPDMRWRRIYGCSTMDKHGKRVELTFTEASSSSISEPRSRKDSDGSVDSTLSIDYRMSGSGLDNHFVPSFSTSSSEELRRLMNIMNHSNSANIQRSSIEDDDFDIEGEYRRHRSIREFSIHRPYKSEIIGLSSTSDSDSISSSDLSDYRTYFIQHKLSDYLSD